MFWHQLALHGGILAAVYGVLRWLSALSWTRELLVLAVALFVAAFLVDALRFLLPRRIIDGREEKAVFITGCDSGFGHSLAAQLSELGFRVFAGCLAPEGEGARRLTARHGGRLTVVPCDVTSQQQVEHAVVTVGALLRNCSLHAVVNNAGIFTIAEVEWCPLEMYRRLFEINCLGAIRVTKAFLPLIRAHGAGGRVVIVASLAGRYTIPGLSAYSASKHASISFADALRREMHKFNISVHTVEPSTYRTPILDEGMVDRTVNKDWEAAAAEMRQSYGEHYRDEFKGKFLDELKNARPVSKIHEVVDDMVDAAVGVEPRSRYVPSAVVTLRSRLLQALPTPLLDLLLERRACPPTPPAAVIRQREAAARRRRQLQSPYLPSGQQRQRPSVMKRYFSVPVFDMPPPTPPASGQSERVFSADDQSQRAATPPDRSAGSTAANGQ